MRAKRKPRTEAWVAPAGVLIAYVTKEWPWAEPPPPHVMRALRALDKLTQGKFSR